MWRKGKKRADGESGGGDGAPPYKKAARDDSDDSADGIVVCELSKNRRVSVRTFQGRIVVDIREFYVKDGKTLPGKKGVDPGMVCETRSRYRLHKLARFKESGAVGAVDGTLINAWAPTATHNSCRARKGNITQNVLVACDFDMMFTFVYSGWEGSANDSRVILEALQSGMFQRPPDDKYYLVDCGYSNMPGFLAPYRGERYHLHDFDGVGNEPIHQKELFNRRHSRLRNVIERTFGVFKKRFPIFKYMTNYKPTRQVLMVNACCGLHNFIRRYSTDDSFFASFGDEDFVPPFVAQQHEPNIPVLDLSQQSLARMARRRDVIAQNMWNAEFG